MKRRHRAFWGICAAIVFGLAVVFARAAERSSIFEDGGEKSPPVRPAPVVPAANSAPHATTAPQTRPAPSSPKIPSSPPKEKRGAPAATVIDLVAAFDPRRDVAEGEFSRSSKGLTAHDDKTAAVLRFAYRPPAEYDFLVDFTNKGEKTFLLLLPRGKTHFLWLMGQPGTKSGFFPVGGGRIAETGIQSGKRYTFRLEVRETEVRAVLDDRVIRAISRPAPAESVQDEKFAGDPSAMGLVAWGSDVVFHRIAIAEIKGKGAWKGTPPGTVAGGVPKAPVNLPPVSVLAVNREPVPSVTQQAAAQKVVKDLYGAVPADPAKRQEMAANLLTQGLDPHNDAPSRYVLLRTAMDMFAGASDVRTATRAAEELARYFSVGPDAKVEALRRSAAAVKDPAAAKTVADCAMETVDQALAATDFDLAAKVMPSAESAARVSRDAALIAAVTARSVEVRFWQQESARAKTAAEKLAAKPDDPDANLIVGRFACFARQDWARGLLMLAKGPPGPLKTCAALEAAVAGSSAQQIARADAWWQIWEKDKSPFGKRALARSAHWYEQALADPQISGLVKVRAEKRLDEAKAAGGAIPTSSPSPRT